MITADEIGGCKDSDAEKVSKHTFHEHARTYVARKRLEKSEKRCQRCWLDLSELCICDRLPSLNFPNVDFILYQDFKEFMNPGDDGKLLMCTSGEQTKLVLYPHEDEKMLEILGSVDPKHVCILFPGPTACTSEEFLHNSMDLGANWGEILKGCEPHSSGGSHEGWDCRSDNDVAIDGGICKEFGDKSGGSGGESDRMSSPTRLTVIVIDGVWRHARKMAHNLLSICPHIRHVQLTPQRLSVYARTQTQPDRICSIEACALLLEDLGAPSALCSQLVACVQLNNSALKRKR